MPAPDPVTDGHALRTDLIQFARLLALRFQRVRCTQIAGSLAFTTLLSLVPLLTVTLAVMSRFPQFARLGSDVRAFLLANLLPDRAGKVIATYALQFSQKAANLTVIGSVLLVATAIMLLVTVDRAFHSIWHLQRRKPVASRLAFYWMALSLGPVVLALSVAAAGALDVSVSALDGPRWLESLVARAMPPLLLSGFFALLFAAVPSRATGWRAAVVGGVVAGLGVLLMQRLFGLYVSRFPNFTLIYGTFSAVPIFLLWLYLTWLVILTGAVVAATLPEYRTRTRLLPASAAGRFYAALLMFQTLAQAQARGASCALGELAVAARLPQDEAERLLASMRGEAWLTQTDEGRWLLLREAQSYRLREFFARFVFATHTVGRLHGSADRIDAAGLKASVEQMLAALDRPALEFLQQHGAPESR